jgi:protein-disulfide isomerase
MKQKFLEKQKGIQPQVPERKYIKIPVPSMKMLDDSKYTPFYVILLLIMAFLLGAATTKMQILNGTGAVQQVTAHVITQTPAAPQKVANVVLGDYPPKGDKNAKVKIVEYADLRCPFCEKFFTDTESQILSDYVTPGKANFTFVNYAFLGSASTVAANAAECANEQGKFWDFHDYLYKNQPSETDTSLFTTDGMTQIAGQLGMDTNQFSSCLSSNKYNKQVSDDLAAGQKEGVSGTPTTFINGTPIVGAVPYAQIKTEIDKALQ